MSLKKMQELVVFSKGCTFVTGRVKSFETIAFSGSQKILKSNSIAKNWHI
jgi:hypothetical protein